MTLPLTDDERRIWLESAEDLLAHPEWAASYGTYTAEQYANNRLRYEATLQEKDAVIAKLLAACKMGTEEEYGDLSLLECAAQLADGASELLAYDLRAKADAEEAALKAARGE